MASVGYKQDMPPPGGYKRLPFTRVPGRGFMSGYATFAIYGAVTAAAWALYFRNKWMLERLDIERRSSRLAIEPLLLAERDRMYLKHARKVRDEEEKLMADYPGWEVGTWLGEPVFKTVPKDYWFDPNIFEMYVHSNLRHFDKRAYLNLVL